MPHQTASGVPAHWTAAPSRAAPLQRHFVNKTIVPGFTFGVLRREFAGLVNDTVVFGWSKLHPIRPVADPAKPGQRIWQPTAARHDVLLPALAPDLMRDPRRLFETFEEQAVVRQDDLAVTIKLTFDNTLALHSCWERARAFARTHLVVAHGLPTLIVLHVPSCSGMRQPSAPHIHLVTLSRTLDAHGFGAFCRIARDEAHPVLAEAWRGSGSQ